MAFRPVPVALRLAVAALLVLMPVAASAQSVLLHVTSSDTAQPIFGALAHLLDEAGVTLRSVLTDERGRALFAAIPAARYRVRVEMIGMATRETTVFDVAAGSVYSADMLLDPRPIDLARIDVTAERRRCTTRPAGEGLLVATLWEEARKALSAAALTDRQGQYRYETLLYERDMDVNGRLVLREEESRRAGYMRAPFESLPPEDFAEGGFVRRDGGELVWYAPDARVLLDESFLDTHCFRVVERSAQDSVIGLGFEPMSRRGSRVDVSGTLWLHEQTAELRWLDYLYANLDLDVAAPTAGGRVEFQRMPAGTWIIPEWWIDMPMVGNRVLPNGTSGPVLRGMRRTGGRVLTVHQGGGRVMAGRRQTGGVEGLVVDSSGAPAVGLRVGVLGQEVFTDAEGRFALLGLSEGLQRIRFVDPGLLPSGLPAPTVERAVIIGEMSYLEFLMPTVGELMQQVCSSEVMPPGTGALVGRVVDQSGVGWQSTTVRVTWADVDFLGTPGLGRSFLQDRDGLQVSTAPDGAYVACGAPTGVRLSVSTLVDGTEELGEPVTIPNGSPGRIHEIGRLR